MSVSARSTVSTVSAEIATRNASMLIGASFTRQIYRSAVRTSTVAPLDVWRVGVRFDRSLWVTSETRAVVIGGGIVGCSVAYHLASLGWTEITLLEQ
ncbi:MAG: FAD-binding oxidoreductase, partial [Hamadaea sp.]|nr:FAD-binding oxidoreductase [Hamadaea sp.]